MLKLIYLNRLLYITHEEIYRARLERKFNAHLKEDTFSKSQFSNVKCFSDNRLRIKYSCMNASSSARLISLK